MLQFLEKNLFNQTLLGRLSAALLAVSLNSAVFYFYLTTRSSKTQTSSRSKLEKGQPEAFPGLENIGNSCYANALLQGIAGCSEFLAWLQRVHLQFATLQNTKRTFLFNLRLIILKLNNKTDLIEDEFYGVDTFDLIGQLLTEGWIIESNTQQDLYELFNVFVTSWDEEISNRLLEKNPSSLGSIANVAMNEEVHEKIVRLSDLVLQRLLLTNEQERVMRPPCVGLIASQLQCQICCAKRIRCDRFCALSLSIPKQFNGQRLTLEYLLRRHFATETISGATCEKCKEQLNRFNTGLVKKQGFAQLPQCLIMRIERAAYLPSGTSIKLRHHVEFPETLDVGELCLLKDRCYETGKELRTPEVTSRIVGGGSYRGSFQRPVPGLGFREHALINGCSLFARGRKALVNKYQLRAVSVHSGSMENGHFVTYRRAASSNDTAHVWYCADDHTVRKVSYRQVSSVQAYMLYYQRMSSKHFSL